jgi:ABC-2 type transport system ATP-binding protein
MEEAVNLSNQVGIVKDGKLVVSGSTKELTESRGFSVAVTAGTAIPDAAVNSFVEDCRQVERTSATELTIAVSSVDAATMRRLTDALEQSGLGEARIDIRSASLRETFLEATR